MVRLLVLDYSESLSRLQSFATKVDQAYPQEEYLELFYYLLREYFSNGPTGVYREITKMTYDDSFDQIEQVFGDDAVALVEMIDCETRQWLPGYNPTSFDKGLLDLRKQHGARVILEIKEDAFQTIALPINHPRARGLQAVQQSVLRPVCVPTWWRQ